MAGSGRSAFGYALAESRHSLGCNSGGELAPVAVALGRPVQSGGDDRSAELLVIHSPERSPVQLWLSARTGPLAVFELLIP